MNFRNENEPFFKRFEEVRFDFNLQIDDNGHGCGISLGAVVNFVGIFYKQSAIFVLKNISYCVGIKVQGMSQLLHNFEAIDPEVIDVLTFNSKTSHMHKDRGDASEINLMDIDTSDILNCFTTLSVSKGVTPPITEQILASRHITDENSLGSLLKEIFEDFMDTHVLRITVPIINARLDARSSRGHCYDFNLGDAKLTNNTLQESETGRNKDPTCYRGDQTMVALSSVLVMKMLMLLPTLLKVIAAKAIFGLIMGIISVILSKMSILPLLLSYTKKNNYQANATPTGSSYRQGINLNNYALTTDNYALYYAQDEQSSGIQNGNSDNNIISQDYGALGTNNDNLWGESKLLNRNYENQNKDIKYIPRKERYRSLRRRSTSKPKKSTYPEMIINGISVDGMNFVTTEETNTDIGENIRETLGGNLLVRTKRRSGSPYYYRVIK
ncbi:hypothetical protein PGB90_008122 [Kerria lacca]